MSKVKVTRKTTESNMTVIIEKGPVKADYRSRIDTPIPFLSHMIEHISWRSGINIETNVKLDKFFLSHVVCEDLGITLGKAVAEYLSRQDGAYGYGSGVGIIDEAKADSAISFEGRAFLSLDYGDREIPHMAENMLAEDLETFLEGFVQGAVCTLHIDLQKGKNSHHIWEAMFRAFGIALGNALETSPSRKGMTSGVAGKIEFIVE